MSEPIDSLTTHLIRRIGEVQSTLISGPVGPVQAEDRFSDFFDSMGMVEFLARLADDCRVSVEAIEQCAGLQFGTVAELAAAMQAAGIAPRDPSPAPRSQQQSIPTFGPGLRPSLAWLVATAARLPDKIQPASTINRALQRPSGWLENHAGILERHIWADQDPVAAAVEAGQECIQGAGLTAAAVGALLVTSEAPPLLAGLAAALHHRLGLGPGAAALEVGGACTGFLAALWLARGLVAQAGIGRRGRGLVRRWRRRLPGLQPANRLRSSCDRNRALL
jgi:hypothetical protein